MRKKILLVKLGYSETLDSEIGKVPSLGDVIRTTPILWAIKEKFPDSHITWLVSAEAYELIEGNPLLDRTLVWDSFIPFQLMREKYDVVINLEKIPGVAAIADSIDAWLKIGFRFNSSSGEYHAYEKGIEFVEYINDKNKNKKSIRFWQRMLIEMLGVQWKNQKYIIGYKPSGRVKYDIGLNYKVGSKWPNKAMSYEKWCELEKRLTSLGYSVTMQKGLDNLKEYMEWINSSKLLITQDSLGLHLGIGFNKKIIALFGPTSPNETFLYGRGIVVKSDVECECQPCYSCKCISRKNCMDNISLDKIKDKVTELIKISS